MTNVMRHSTRPQKLEASLIALILAVGGGLGAGCSGSGGDTTGSGGRAGTGGRTGSGGQTGTGGQSGTGGAQGSGGAVGSGGQPGSGGQQGTGGSGGGAPGTGGSTPGTGGSGQVGTGGRGGGGAGGSTGSGGAAGGNNGSGGSAGGSGSGGAAGGGGASCPNGATFCTGFEETGLPAGVTYKVNAAPGEWTRDFERDTTVKRGGAASLRVKTSADAGTSGSAYKLLAAPAPMGAFWVRFYIRSEIDLGGQGHNVFAGAANTDDPNAQVMTEFAEDVGIAFNDHDNVVRPDGHSRDNPFRLPKDVWHCIEISYDSTMRVQRLFIDGMMRINAMDWPPASAVAMPYKVFKFGFNQLHGPARKVWFDDIAVGPQRIPCL